MAQASASTRVEWRACSRGSGQPAGVFDLPGRVSAGRWDGQRSVMRYVLLFGLAVLVLAGCGGSAEGSGVSTQQPKRWSQPPAMELTPGTRYQATLQTSKGDIVIDLLSDEAPMTVNNFVFLARQGFYNSVPFHRVIKGFMIQTGDPTGTGSGGPGYTFPDEAIKRDYTPGTVAMANAGPNTNGSQFFIVQGDMSGGRLQKNYTIFGEVVQGMDVVNAIASVPVKANQLGELSSPTEPVLIKSVEIATK